MSSNFSFLPPAFDSVAESARLAESCLVGDPRGACFHARFALEAAVHWIYRYDASLKPAYDASLGSLIHEPTFQNLLPEAVFQKARVIQQMGNRAAHEFAALPQADALQVVKELHHFCYWMVRSYAPEAALDGAEWSDGRVPQPLTAHHVATRQELEALELRLEEHAQQTFQNQLRLDAMDQKMLLLRGEFTAKRAAAAQVPDTHEYSEAETRHYLIDLELHRAGWPLDQTSDREYEVSGMPNGAGRGYVDYVLWGDDGKALAVVEAKRTTADAQVGQQQAKLYADCLEAMQGQRPLIFYTNGYETWLWDDVNYPPRRVAGFYKKEELARTILRRGTRLSLATVAVKSS